MSTSRTRVPVVGASGRLGGKIVRELGRLDVAVVSLAARAVV